MNKIITIILSIFSLTVFAQDNYYYYNEQRIPLTINQKKVNIITPLSNMQHAPSFRPNMLKPGLEIENVVNTNNVSMCVVKEKMTHSGVLNQYVDSIRQSGICTILPCYINSKGEELVPSGYIYVKLKNQNDYSLLLNVANSYGFIIDHQNIYMPLWYILHGNQETILESANAMYATGLFKNVEPDFVYSSALNSISWDSNVSQQWGLYNAENSTIDINASSAWNYATGRGVKIGVIDTGIDKNHIDLKDNMSELCYDVETGSSVRAIYNDHGTFVAGVISAVRNNGKFITGVAPDAELVSISATLSSSKVCESEKLANGINWAVENGVEILNCSWKRNETQIIVDAINNALANGRNNRGCVVVFAVGNDSIASVSFPANCNSEILTVGAIDNLGNKADFSNYGIELDVVAPGVNIYSLLPYNFARFNMGTSFAAPHVAGIAALILELNKDLSGRQVCNIIERSTTRIGSFQYINQIGRDYPWNQFYGYGLVDALKAVMNTPRKKIEY